MERTYDRKPERRFDRKEGQRFDRKKRTIVEEIAELDGELLKLLSRRAKLLKKTRRPKKEGAGTSSIPSEKQLRLLWEANAAKFSKDPRLAHQLFALLQDIEFISKDFVDEKGDFTLAPYRRPVEIDLPGFACLRSTRLWMALAAGCGSECHISGVLSADPIHEFLKSLNQAGASVSLKGNTLICKEGRLPEFADKVIFAGNEELNFYLLALMAVARPGILKFTGASALKDADLTAFRNFLPQMGARIAHAMPRSNGLPVRLECSGVIADAIAVPADLPADAVTATLIAAALWNMKVTLNLTSNEHASRCLAEAKVVLDACGIVTEGEEGAFTYLPGPADIPFTPSVAMDPALNAMLLSVPAFAKGAAKLTGTWPVDGEEGRSALALLQSAGLQVVEDGDAVICEHTDSVKSSAALQFDALPNCYFPLAVALACVKAHLSGEGVRLPELPEGVAESLVEGFAAQANIMLVDGMLLPGEDVPATEVWTSPDAYWTIALALIAFIKPKIKLANPGTVTDLMPSFWMFYNGLPKPDMTPRKKEISDDKPKRRRIIAE